MKVIKFWVPPVLWAGTIFYLSSMSQVTPGYGIWDEVIAYCGHLTEYLILGFLIRRALVSTTKIVQYKCSLAALVISVFYAVSDEFHQSFVPMRDASVIDVIVDSFGAAAAVWLLPWIEINIQKMSNKK